jgi:clan AA aspartic protease
MIRGIVTASREGIISMTVGGPGGESRKIEAVVDTGFDGWLSLPPGLVRELRLAWKRRGRALLADGSETLFDIYDGIVLWDKRRRRIPVDEAATAPLVGMNLMSGYELRMQVRSRGKVSLTPLPPRRR